MQPWEVWETLGIEPGTDERGVRRAYAKRLRTESPEDDPESFKRLRAAYDHALQWSRNAAAFHDCIVDEPAGEGGLTFITPETGSHQNTVPVDPLSPSRAMEPHRWTDTSRPPPDHAARREIEVMKQRIIHAIEEGADQEQALLAQMRDLWDHPVLDLGLLADIEDWTAQQLAGHLPQSDALLRPAFARYRWDEPNRARDLPYSVSVLAARLREHDFIHAVSQPAHELHAGWTALSRTPQPLKDRIAVRNTTGNAVQYILNLLDQAMPGLVWSLDRDAVDWWRRQLAKPHVSGASIALALLLVPLFGLATFVAAYRRPLWAGVFGCLAVLCIGLPWINEMLVRRPAAALREHSAPLPAWKRDAWMILGIGTIILQTIFPLNAVTVTLGVVGMATAFVLMLITMPQPPVLMSALARKHFFGDHGAILYLLGLTALLGTFGRPLMLTYLALAILLIGSRSYGRDRINRLVEPWMRRQPRAATLALLVGWTGLIALITILFNPLATGFGTYVALFGVGMITYAAHDIAPGYAGWHVRAMLILALGYIFGIAPLALYFHPELQPAVSAVPVSVPLAR